MLLRQGRDDATSPTVAPVRSTTATGTNAWYGYLLRQARAEREHKQTAGTVSYSTLVGAGAYETYRCGLRSNR